MVKLDVKRPSDFKAISTFIKSVMCVVKEMGYAADHEFEIEQAPHEALNNAIEHGSADDLSKQIQCCVACG